MNKILKKLTNEAMTFYKLNYNNDDFYEKEYIFKDEIGHYKIFVKNSYIYHYYYGSLICFTNLELFRFTLNYCGYKNYRLTKAQINFLKQYYINEGLQLVAITEK